MDAELIAVGRELLRLGRQDRNGDWLVDQLNRQGVAVVARSLVDDDAGRIASSVRTAIARADLVLVTGGLGPTEDDRTREGLAAGLDRPLRRDEERAKLLRRLFHERGRAFGPSQAKQADRPEGARWLENPLGTAPGIRLEANGTELFALPGVPAEMKAIFLAEVLPFLEEHAGGGVARRVLKVAGRIEASVDEQLRDLYSMNGVQVTVLAGREGIELHLLGEGLNREEASAALDRLEREMSRRLGDDLYARDDRTLPGEIGRLLKGMGRSVATAESCTAGLLAAAFTTVPGSSAWYRGGFVVYSDDLKTELVGVRAESLARHGAVSELVAEELARGARRRCRADFGMGITGIAGPGGGTEERPVGRVHVALDDGRKTSSWCTRQFGDRALVRSRTVTFALDRLRRRLLEERRK